MTTPLLTFRRGLGAVALALLLASGAAAQDLPTSTFGIQGVDTAGDAVRGTLQVTPGRTALDVSLELTFARDGEVVRTAGSLRRSTEDETVALGPLMKAAPGMAGALGGASSSANGMLRLDFDATARSVDVLWYGPRGLVHLEGLRERVDVEGAGWEALAGAQKQEALWREVAALPHGRLPRFGSAGVGEALGDTFKAFNRRVLEKTFTSPSGHTADVREPRTKIFHPFGATAKVRFAPAAGHPYTGLLASGAPGIARLSLATDESSFIPGMGLKLLVDGQPSLNVHAIPNFDGQSSRDFFLRSLCTTIPEPSSLPLKLFARVARKIADPFVRRVDHLTGVDRSGRAAVSPRAPARLRFHPAGVHFATRSTADVREQLAGVPVGSVIYSVYAEEDGQPDVHVGDLRTESTFVSSAFSDRVLHFLHAR